MRRWTAAVAAIIAWWGATLGGVRLDAAEVDFNRDIRSILSNHCFTCHGPDVSERQSGLRLDTAEGAFGGTDSGSAAIVPGEPAASELMRRVTSDDPYERMPPEETGKELSDTEIRLLRDWIAQGATYAQHWAYTPPSRPAPPTPTELKHRADSLDTTVRRLAPDVLAHWPANDIDRFTLRRMIDQGMLPSERAERHVLLRRVSLDLTGLPPSPQEVERFINDTAPHAWERLIDRLLRDQAYGEHWARQWLDLARYADSAGYADDPPRTIWAYRDYVIDAFNTNKPFDEFTIEQIAGDLLADPTDEQLIATAFHRNTQTNNEGGTNDEEFRNVAVVDRVNTTMAVWMGTTMACAQCHNHKYDPISQEEYFRFFAILNNSVDADRRDESPTFDVWSREQRQQRDAMAAKIAELERQLRARSPAQSARQVAWETRLGRPAAWHVPAVTGVETTGHGQAAVASDGWLQVPTPGADTTATVTLASDGLAAASLSGLRIETDPAANAAEPLELPDTAIALTWAPADETSLVAQTIRVENPGTNRILSLAEVQVFSGDSNVATTGRASQSTTGFNGPAHLAIDGNTAGDYTAGSTTHTEIQNDPWWELKLDGPQPITRIVLWNRTDNNLQSRLQGFRVKVMDAAGQLLWETTESEAPRPSRSWELGGVRSIRLVASPALPPGPESTTFVLQPAMPDASSGTLRVRLAAAALEQLSTRGRFRLSISGAPQIAEMATLPAEVAAALRIPAADRTAAQDEQVWEAFRQHAPETAPTRDQLARLREELSALRPTTTVPVMRELPAAQHRTTRVQYRGSYLAQGPTVEPGVPEIFHALPAGMQECDRLALARWLVDESNPLTARVVANRYWEALFGKGIVATSEEFGSQGELPTHPELLDWLAVELMESGWNVKHLLKLIVTSATYQQSSRVTPATWQRDPENTYLARGPRFRLTAEMVRDQALAVSGLLSRKMYGPPVKPLQPSLGLNAAFGGGIDWQTSGGEDRYRRALYTTWRRSNPYPSMSAFDAPNREVCTVRRDRTNTPLQALVTLNDPVYIEAAQALARDMMSAGEATAQRASHGFQRCLVRPPGDAEVAALVETYQQALARFALHPSQAHKMATDPLGPVPAGRDPVELAAWTVVANVLLNLDEVLLKP